MIAWFATKGSGTNEARRIEYLLSDCQPRMELPFDKSDKRGSLFRLWKAIRTSSPSLLVMEGTGLAGGLACLGARLLHGIPYIVSSGDAVGPFIRGRHPAIGFLFEIYERLLCRFSAGFIGWTPYLCGRAMTFGAPRAVTAQGWVIGGQEPDPAQREALRAEWNIPKDGIVAGIVGNLEWNSKIQWCYGLDLVKAMQRVSRRDLYVLVVGSGSGLEHLKKEAGADLGKRIFLPGQIPLEKVMTAMSLMDVASLPQSMDQVGMFRYTTKLPEYAGCALPVITNQVPMAYDLGDGWMWRLPGKAPWEADYLSKLTSLLSDLSPEQIQKKKAFIPDLKTDFDMEAQRRRVGAFISDITSSVETTSNGHAS